MELPNSVDISGDSSVCINNTAPHLQNRRSVLVKVALGNVDLAGSCHAQEHVIVLLATRQASPLAVYVTVQQWLVIEAATGAKTPANISASSRLEKCPTQ